jgi:RNA polymerase sigma-70 factor (ECF subfamily)
MAEVSEARDHQLTMQTTDSPAQLGRRFPAVLAQAVAGDSSAFGELWRSAQPGLLRYLYVLCGGQAAEDVASDTWLKVIRSLHTFSGDEQAFRAWLTTVARNTAKDRGRRLGRHPERLDGPVPDDIAAIGSHTDDLAIEALSTQAVLNLILTTLTPQVAEMVVLRVIIGLDVAHVADLVGRSPGAVRVAVHRGLKSLADALVSPAPYQAPRGGVAGSAASPERECPVTRSSVPSLIACWEVETTADRLTVRTEDVNEPIHVA